jgi:hypothetical protein
VVEVAPLQAAVSVQAGTTRAASSVVEVAPLRAALAWEVAEHPARQDAADWQVAVR